MAGCVPQGKPDAEYIRGLSVVGVQQIDRVVEVVEETLKGNQVSNLVIADFNCSIILLYRTKQKQGALLA